MCYLFIYPSLALTYEICLSSSSTTNPAMFIWSLVFCLFIFRVYLTLAKAVTLILKHETLLRTSMSSKSALTNAELDYQKANFDVTIQQHLTACDAGQSVLESVEQFVGFIMSTDIGLLPFSSCHINILFFFSIISVLSSCRCIENTLKQFLK